jgi:hypothetical protein
LYAIFLQRKALELQQQQMKREIGEVREQTKLLADQFQQIAPIGRAYDRLEATEAVLNAVYDGGKASISEAIFQLPRSEVKTRLEQSLAAFLNATEIYLEAGSQMEIDAMARGLARGGIVKARQKWMSKREELARQLEEWGNGIRKRQADAEQRSLPKPTYRTLPRRDSPLRLYDSSLRVLMVPRDNLFHFKPRKA